MMMLLLLTSLITTQLFCAADNCPQAKRITISGEMKDVADTADILIPYTCGEEVIFFDTEALSGYSPNKNFNDLIQNLCNGLKTDQIKLLIKAIGKNNEAVRGSIDHASSFAQSIQEKDFEWLLKKTRNYGINYVHSALITRISTDPNFAYTVSNSGELTDSTFIDMSKKIDRERIHKIITGCLRKVVQLNLQHGTIKSIFFDKQNQSKMFLANSSGAALYDLAKREMVQEVFPKGVREDSVICYDRAGDCFFELNDGLMFLWELQFAPARRSQLNLEKGIIKMRLNSSDSQFFAQYKDKLLLYDIKKAESKEVPIPEDFDCFNSDENGYSVHYKDDDTLCIEHNGNRCVHNPETSENHLIKLPEALYKDRPEVIYNEYGTEALLKFADKLLMYNFKIQKEVPVRLPLKQSESLIGIQYCDHDTKLLIHTGHRICIYDIQTSDCIASYPIQPQYNKLIYRPKTLIAVDNAEGQFVLYPIISLRTLDPKQILFLFKASACWHINRRYGIEKEEYAMFSSLPEQLRSGYLFYYAEDPK